LATLRRVALGTLLLLICQQSASAQIGALLNGVGPINRSMSGASTAAPLDTLGAFQWNPATITALPSSADFSLEMMLPHANLASSISPGALGGGFPPVPLSGSNKSDSGVFPLPSFGVVYQPDESAVTYGLGIMSVGGFSANFPGSLTNPITTAPPPNGLGVGPIFAQYQLVQVVPTVAVQLTDRLSVGFSPIVDLAGLSADPGFLAAPDDANGDGHFTYPPLNHGRFQWGAGFQVGAFYVTEARWQFGASFKSTQWFRNFDYNSQNEIGQPRTIQLGVDAPMVVSVGVGYTGFDRFLIALDARYLDYHNTRPLGPAGFTPTGAVSGLGWDNVFALGTGVQYQATEAFSVRAGYSYNTNPIPSKNTFFNIMTPLIIQHGVTVGASYCLTQSFKVSLAYAHYFQNSISGPFVSPAFGPLAGTNVTAKASADAITAGATFAY
jgi:long-chain fatty acid transport protein